LQDCKDQYVWNSVFSTTECPHSILEKKRTISIVQLLPYELIS
jgi:hypothetical protein